MSTFFVIGTPIGNLEDITLRALKALAGVDLVLCEDTRVTKRLLERHGIKTPTMSYHAHSKISRVGQILDLLRNGGNMALVSDAGTPGISDPGAELISRIREECGNVRIESMPGPSALTAALSVAGVPTGNGFTFMGFLPHKKGRETAFGEIAAMERPAVFYESPHRLMKTLDSLARRLEVSGGTDGSAGRSRAKKVTVCRELTKIFEEVVSGSPAEAGSYFGAHPEKIKGEFVIIVSGA